ncbi:MAG: cytidine deaminase [Peptococcaceae bacterium]|nr:cytidine deaminase [Peptococcaceae bacterium]
MKNNGEDNWDALIEAAWKAREMAYAPYSGFQVGAAVQTASGSIYGGCNIENVSYGLTNCAERTAMFQAVANGERQLQRIVVCADTPEPVSPCGACRQVMQELGPQMEVLLINREGRQIHTTVAELLPYSFQDFPQSGESHKGDM